jgi:tetratricopeptide (TPR) repeat protein
MRFLLLLLVFLIAACSGVKTHKDIEEKDISAPVKQKIEEARELIRGGKLKEAVAKLSELNDDKIEPIEKALKYNLKGVTLFNIGDVEKAILNFKVAEKYTPEKTQLYGQVQLNMASGHYRLGQFNEMKESLAKIKRKDLAPADQKKFSQLSLAYGNKFENHFMIVSSSIGLLAEAKTMADVQNSGIYTPMKTSFLKPSQTQKFDLLEDYNDSKNIAIANLAELEADNRYMNGDKDGAKEVVSWLNNSYAGNEEVTKFVKDFELRMENSGKISISDIGLVLPLNDSNGKKALSGVDTGLKVLGLGESVKIHMKDATDSPAQAAQGVLELIREHKVAFIIGGLYPQSAKAEYLEAKKYGVLFISLSQINLPKEEKNNNLIEVQGSIESQVETLLSDEMIGKFGQRIGVIFPENEGGKACVDEIYSTAVKKNLQVTSIASFAKNTHDFRDPAQLFLGLSYPRERSEELKILDDVYSLEKTAIRRVQTLPPVIDFDWVFLATYPPEATGLISTLGYYDANRIKVVGGPSWASKSMVKEQKNLGTLYFVGDDPKDINQAMLKQFEDLYKKPAGLVEVLALDAMKLGAESLSASGEVTGRDEFDTKLKEKGSIKGLSTSWNFKDGVWLKKMNAMTITQGEIVKLFEVAPTSSAPVQN